MAEKYFAATPYACHNIHSSLERRQDRYTMENSLTYECRKCGKQFTVSEKEKKLLVPVYCCGEEAVKGREKKPAAKKKTRK
ncbi:MAG: hypothetical protein OEW04_01015 [Nitrospirota bacterium]|nr:hypothetical protein [Nitrospirota bacterium]